MTRQPAPVERVFSLSDHRAPEVDVRHRREPVGLPRIAYTLGLHIIARLIYRVLDNQEHIMATVDDLVGKVEGLKTDVTRVLDALGTEHLSPETQAKVDALAASLDEVNTEMDSAVPEPAPAEPTPAVPAEPSQPTDG